MQTILITGAASGIGRAAVLRAAALGWRCMAVDRDAAGLQQLLQALPPCALGPHQALVVDLLDADAITQLAQQVPMLDALVNNAGMSSGSNQPLVEMPAVEHERLLQLNLHAPAQLVQVMQSRMVPGARVVNVASGAGLRAIPWRGLYSASKAGLIAQTQVLARARTDWCVTVLSPGFVRTALVDSLLQSGRLRPEGALAKIALGRMAEPEELAEAICFLASPAAQPLSGQVLVVDGGSSVYGGSQPLPAATVQPVPYGLPTRWQVQGHDDAVLQLGALNPTAGVPAYEACVDFSAWQGARDQVMAQVLQAAQRFALQHASTASLLLVLPRPRDVGDHMEVVSHAAARMLVTTLACEWGSRGLRINAIEVDAGAALADVQPVLNYLCGARAQFVTGQTLIWQPKGRAMHNATSLSLDSATVREQIKQDFITQRGYWRPWVETLLEEIPQFVAQYARYAGYPAKNGPLSERMVELVYVALDASSSHLFEAGLATHMQKALEVGASAADIFDVLHLVAVQGLACVGVAAEILQELAPEPALPDAESASLQARLAAAQAAHGLALQSMAQMDPGYAQVLLDFAEHGAQPDGLNAAERCLVQLALHACFTAFQPQAVRTLMGTALELGCSKAEVFQTIQLGAHLAVHGTALGAKVYRQISRTNSSASQ